MGGAGKWINYQPGKKEKSTNISEDRESEGGTQTEFMWFRAKLRRSDVIHFSLSRGIHLPPSCNYGALFPLLIHLNVCVSLLWLLEHTHIDVHTQHTHAHTPHKATLLCNKSLITGSSCFLFPSLLCSGSRSCFPLLCIISRVLLNTAWSPLHPKTLGHMEEETDGLTDSKRNTLILLQQIIEKRGEKITTILCFVLSYCVISVLFLFL